VSKGQKKRKLLADLLVGSEPLETKVFRSENFLEKGKHFSGVAIESASTSDALKVKDGQKRFFLKHCWDWLSLNYQTLPSQTTSRGVAKVGRVWIAWISRTRNAARVEKRPQENERKERIGEGPPQNRWVG